MSEKQSYIVSARKYRPATFRSVVGQRALTATLKNAISGGKLAQAYLFCGPRGVGKTSCARIFAKTINCMNPTPDGEACGQCESCTAIDRGTSFNLVELDAASNNSVNDIRDITNQVNVPAQNGRYRVFIIDEVHMLSQSAFNAFLKTLEEPPKNVIFILATTERHKVLPTILSRCQIYDFRRITINDIIDHLEYVASQEGIEAEREALGVIALKSDGAMRDALSIFDQVAASTQGKVTYAGTIENLNVLDHDYYFRLLDIFKQGSVPQALLTLKEITDKGFDPQFFINGLAEHIRNLMVASDPATVNLLETSEDMNKKYMAQASLFPVDWYYTAMKILNDADYNYRLSSNKRLLVELALIRLCRLERPGQPQTQTITPQPSPSPISSPTATQGVAPNAGVNQPSQAVSKAESSQSSAPFQAPDGRPTPGRQQGDNGVKSQRSGLPRPASYRISDRSNLIKAGSTGTEKRESAFTEEDLSVAWDKFISDHQEQRILTAAMRVCRPQKTDETNYRITVEHPAQKQALESILGELSSFLRDALANDNINISIAIDETKDESRQIPPKEFLKKTIEENPEMARFLSALDAEIV